MSPINSPIVDNFLSRFGCSGVVSADTLSSGGDFVMARDEKIRVEYAPFDYVRPGARLVIVGITPGRQQARVAVRHLRDLLARNIPLERAMVSAKETASFSGPLRNNLIRLLDFTGLPEMMGMPDAAALFRPGAPVHFTSALRYPVFRCEGNVGSGENYNGRNPAPLKVPMLRGMIDTFLADEARTLPNAVWVPLGPVVAEILDYLVDKSVLRADQIVTGLPHPSGANVERLQYFLGLKGRERLSARVNPDTLDAAREEVFRCIERIRGAGFSDR